MKEKVFSSYTYVSKDFKPNTGSTQTYSYDDNGNQSRNADKNIAEILYNHLNLPSKITFTGSIGSIEYDYDAEGRKLQQRVYANTTLSSTTDYVGEYVFVNGSLDYIVHDEGRVVYESGQPIYEFYIKDHLGNIRQVLRPSSLSNFRVATMESESVEEESQYFQGIKESRQSDQRHNVTKGGRQVAWLNAGRGRTLGPNTSMEVMEGDSVNLSVYAKFELPTKRAKKEAILPKGVANRLATDLGDLALSGQANPLTLFQIVELIAEDLQKKDAPEAYMGYALYDSDSNLYERGKHILSKKAANKHEELRQKLYISKTGYVETYLVNETNEDVWFDDFTVMSTTPLVVQETHYDPWGLELTGLGYQYGGIKVNRYLYNGKELLDDLNLNLYDYGARYFDPVIGRWISPDPMAHLREWVSPYNFVQNNPLNRIDPDGMLDEWRLNTNTGELDWISDLGGESQQTVHIGNRKTVIEGSKDNIHVGAAAVPGGKPGDFTYTVSKADLWSDLPDEYQGHYNAFDLVERYNAAQKGGIKVRSIREMESQGLSRSDMVWNSSDYGRHLVRKYGSKDSFYMAADLGMIPLPAPAGVDDFTFAGSGMSAINTFSKNRNMLKASSQLNIAARGVKLSNNPWIRFLQENKGSWSGSDWLNQARQAYNVLKK